MSDILIYDKIEKTMTKEGRCYGEDTVFTDLTEAMKKAQALSGLTLSLRNVVILSL